MVIDLNDDQVYSIYVFNDNEIDINVDTFIYPIEKIEVCVWLISMFRLQLYVHQEFLRVS